MAYAQGVTHAAAVVIAAAGRTAQETDDLLTQLSVGLAPAPTGRAPIMFDYHPLHAVKLADEDAPGQGRLRHLLLIKFKVDAPVGRLVAGYAALPSAIPEMLAFEWGPVDNILGEESLAASFEYAFMTTFASVVERDIYLTHAEHTALAGLLFPHIDDVLVLDFPEQGN